MSSPSPEQRPRERRRVLLALLLPALPLVAMALLALAPRTRPAREAAHAALRVCADPNNLPFSNARSEGFENRLAALLAQELGLPVRYTWFAQRRGFVRETLGASACDVIPGIVASSDRVLVTRPYYRSTYVFVRRTDAPRAVARVASLDDPALRRLRIGVHVIGDDYTNTPPAHALAARGIIAQVRGYRLQGDYAQPDPPRALVDAVVRREVDLAIVWGPLAGWAARRGAPVALRPVAPQIDLPFLPFVYDIAVGVRRGDAALRDRLDAALTRRADDVAALLAEYGVPVLPTGAAPRPVPHSRPD
jgi:mxaJ protein